MYTFSLDESRALHWVPMPMGFGWAWVASVLCIPASSSKSKSNFGCREYANQEALRAKANDNEQPFICPIQPRLGVGR